MIEDMTARSFDTAAEMQAAYSARYRRLRTPQKRVKPLEVVEGLVVEIPRHEPPLWQQSDMSFDAHVSDYQDWFSPNVSPTRRYIGRRAVQLGFTYADIIGKRRHIPLVAVRQLLMWEVKTNFDKSFPEIGRLFGGRDHTTALHAFRKIEKLKASERGAA